MLAAQMEQEAKATEEAMDKKLAELTAKLNEAKRQAASSVSEGDIGTGVELPEAADFDDSLDTITTTNPSDVTFSYVHETRPANYGPATGLTPRVEGEDGSEVDLPSLHEVTMLTVLRKIRLMVVKMSP